MKQIFFPAEWHRQSAVQLTWPHDQTDWADMMDEVLPCFVSIAKKILEHERLIVICQNPEDVRKQLGNVPEEKLSLYKLPLDDTWARDHGAISVFVDGKPCIYDFTFNGWGKKFGAENDNRLSESLFNLHVFNPEVRYIRKQPFVLEGGSIESDGEGSLLTTANCFSAPNRNQPMAESEIDAYLKETFGVSQVLWLRNGYLAGDDTDGHIDMLARFCDAKTIVYVTALNGEDEHTPALREMEKELKAFRTLSGEPYRLIKLPMADPVYFEEERLPASYANFLILNGAILMPYYNSPKDEIARKQLQLAFPDRKITGINSLPLIRQHGSLHCLTMQYPEGFISTGHK
jgi:agmatine/peptidylarginine deiminase